MEDLFNCAWVTHAQSKEDLENALILGRSLRRVRTRAKIVLLITPELFSSEDFRTLEEDMSTCFDAVIPDLNEKSNENKFLSVFKKRIFLQPDAFLIKNGDELFNGDKIPKITEIDLSMPQFELRDNLENIIICTIRTNSDEMNASFAKAGLLEKFILKTWLEIKKEMDLGLTSPQLNFKDEIAVIGMSCRFPSANNISEFWKLLIEGGDGIKPPPKGRWTKDLQFNGDFTKQAGFLTVPIDKFDARFFGLSPKEAIFTDPQHRLLLELVWEGLEDAGVDPLEIKGSPVGVFLGQWRNEYRDILDKSKALRGDFYRTQMGNSGGAGAARVAHILGLSGPCLAVESDCAAALLAVHLACKSLQNGESSMALACGVNLLLKPFTKDILPSFLAEDDHCKTFDASADGFVRSEGCSVLVLKRFSDAVKDGDRIWGVIRGSALAQEGLSKSMGTPTVDCEAQAMSLALKNAGVCPSQVSYLEAHGTGTAVGDPIEIEAIKQIYGGVERAKNLVIGSVKTNLGHTESCSGLAGIIKVILSMKNELIPPHLNFKEINPKLEHNLNTIPARLPLSKPLAWPKTPDTPRIAGISSFGITGVDGHLILEEPPENLRNQASFDMERPLHILKITAKNQPALNDLLESYTTLFKKNVTDFKDIAYTANVGRASFPFRAVVIGPDATSAETILATKNIIKTEKTGSQSKICFLFTGQGCQYPGMGKVLYETSPVFRMHFDFCQDFVQNRYSISLKDSLWNSETALNETLFSQIGIFVVEYCLVQLWTSWGIQPDFVLGHSLGEFCALVTSGIVNIEDALTLVVERSLLIQNFVQEGKMLVVKADKQQVEQLKQQFCADLDYAAFNSNEQTVLAGDSEAILSFSEFLKQKQIKCTILNSKNAFHSKHMDIILEKYGNICSEIQFRKPKDSPKFISSVLGTVLEGNEINKNYFLRHTREPVDFLSASKAALREKCSIFLEVGPHPVLSALTMLNSEEEVLNPICLPSLRKNEGNWETMLTSLGELFVEGVNVDWKGFDRFYKRSKVPDLLPSYPFQRIRFWPEIDANTDLTMQTSLHPLLGSVLSNPTETKLFQSNLSLEAIPYLKEHKIGDMTIFPGAGYIETLLVGGGFSLSSKLFPPKPIQLTNFKIESPLVFGEEGYVTCQTVLNEMNGGFFGKIYHKNEENEEWILNASGSINCFALDNASSEIQRMLQSKYENLAKIQKMKENGKELAQLSSFYERRASVGLNLGKSFQTFLKVWRDIESEEALAEVKVPEGDYLVHPCLIDGMLQLAFHWDDNVEETPSKLKIPVGCDNFIWFRRLTTPTCYFYSEAANSRSFVLLDSEGELIAAMIGAQAVDTKVENMKAMLNSKVKSMPDFYSIEWKPVEDSKPGFDFGRAPDALKIIEMPGTIKNEENPEEFSTEEVEINKAVSFYIWKAFLNLGWQPAIDTMINLDGFCVVMLNNYLTRLGLL